MSLVNCLPLMFNVYKADSLWTTWTENGPSHTRYNRSKSGWFDNLCFEEWFLLTYLLMRGTADMSCHACIGSCLITLNIA